MSYTVILHISDLHFSSNEKKKREKENIMNSLIDVLKQLETEWKPNIICVSGDIVDRYDVSAYPLWNLNQDLFRRLPHMFQQ